MAEKKASASAPRLLLTDRAQAIWLERAKVHADHGRVIYRTTEGDLQKSYSLPHANLGILFLGQGTSLSQEASRLLAAEGVIVAFTGTGGAPLHFGALTSYSGTDHFRRMLTAYIDADLSLAMAKGMMRARCKLMLKLGVELTCELLKVDDARKLERVVTTFSAGIEQSSDIPQLLGHEGVFAKNLYAQLASLSKLDRSAPFLREQGSGKSMSAAKDPAELANACIDHGNYLAYGYAAAALWALGIPPHMSVFHGKTRAGGLVFDLADTFKESFVLPIAFAVAAGKLKGEPESVFRATLMRRLEKDRILKRLIETMNEVMPCEKTGPLLNKGRVDA